MNYETDNLYYIHKDSIANPIAAFDVKKLNISAISPESEWTTP